MSILIKGMDMPKSCDECRFCDNDAMCVVLGEDLFDHVQAEVAEHLRFLPDDWKCNACPLVEVPPHGRLIDADKLKKRIRPITEEDDFNACTIRTVKELMNNHIDDAPTIIEAEGE